MSKPMYKDVDVVDEEEEKVPSTVQKKADEFLRVSKEPSLKFSLGDKFAQFLNKK